jgi:DNA-binding HxlR family transcriptional regulator
MSLGLFGHPTVAEVRMLTATRRHVGPLQALLESISNKWVATVLELLTGARELSYGELHRRTNGVSRKMLSATLRDLVRDGLVERRAEHDDASRRVYYRVTDLGRSLVATLDGLRTWAHANMDVIDAARRTYDDSLELAQLP